MPKFHDLLQLPNKLVELPDKVRTGTYIAIASQLVIIVLQLIIIILLVARPPGH